MSSNDVQMAIPTALVTFDALPSDHTLAQAMGLLGRALDDLGAVDQTFVAEWNPNYTRYIAKAVGR